ncbi:16896_t:CDS:2, partial [Racocetra persica]
TIAFNNSTNTTVNLNTPGVILMNEETFRKIITKFTRKKPEEPVLIKRIQDYDESLQVEEQDKLMHNVQTNENNTFNSDHKITDKTVEWSEYEKCYRNKKELCEYCDCSVCKWKGDRDHILLCDGLCGKNFHTRCLNSLLTRIPPRKWYCKNFQSSISRNPTFSHSVNQVEGLIEEDNTSNED